MSNTHYLEDEMDLISDEEELAQMAGEAWADSRASRHFEDHDDDGSAFDPMFDRSDLDDARNYCKHGTFTGNPYGGDYMCGWCESGEEPPTQLELDLATVRRAEEAYERLVQAIYVQFRQDSTCPIHWWASLRQMLVDSVDNFGNSNCVQRAWDRLQAEGLV